MRFYFAVVSLLLTSSALGETPMDRCLKVYSEAECIRLQNTYVTDSGETIYIPPEEPVEITVTYSEPDRLPPVRTWQPAGFYCQPEQNPPPQWLRPGGFCEASAKTAKASLIYGG